MDSSFDLHLQRRGLFSSDVAAYDTGRPGYPERVYELLQEVCGLGPDSAVLEIGPGTGQATGRLLDCGATITAVELGPELAALLQAKHEGRPLAVEVGAFEDVALEPEGVRHRRRGRRRSTGYRPISGCAVAPICCGPVVGSPCGGPSSATRTDPTRSETH